MKKGCMLLPVVLITELIEIFLEIRYNRVKKRKNNADIYSCSGKSSEHC